MNGPELAEAPPRLPCSLCRGTEGGVVMAEDQVNGSTIGICQYCVNSLDAWFINHPVDE